MRVCIEEERGYRERRHHRDVFLVIPFVFIGITAGMLLTQAPFGFIALLGAMSLSGMMIKNAVVLLDQVNINLAEGMNSYNAVVEAAVSRLRPVVNAAAPTPGRSNP